MDKQEKSELENFKKVLQKQDSFWKDYNLKE